MIYLLLIPLVFLAVIVFRAVVAPSPPVRIAPLQEGSVPTLSLPESGEEAPALAEAKEEETYAAMLPSREEKETLLSLINENSGDRDGLNVLIGDNSLRQGLDSTSVVYHKFNLGDNVTGVFGLIGPQRMDYSGVIARLEYVVKNLLGEAANDDNNKS